MKLGNKILIAQEGGEMPQNPEMTGQPQQGASPEAPQENQQMGPQENPEVKLQQIAGQLVDMLMQQIGDPQAVVAILQMATDIAGQSIQQQTPAYQRQGGRLIRVR